MLGLSRCPLCAVPCLVTQSCLTLCEPMDCSLPGSSVQGKSPGKNTGVGCHALLQGIFPIQGLNPVLPLCRRILYRLSHQGSPWMLQWVAYPFSRGSSRPRNRTLQGLSTLQAGSLPADLPGDQTRASAVGLCRLHHWTTREVLEPCSFGFDFVFFLKSTSLSSYRHILEVCSSVSLDKGTHS